MRALGVSVGLTVLGVVLGLIIAILVVFPMVRLGWDVESTPVLLILLLGTQLGFLTAGYFYARRYELTVPLRPLTKRDTGFVIIGVVVALVFANVSFIAFDAVGLTPEAFLEETISEDPQLAIWFAVLSILVVAPVEEYLFRGVIQGRLRNTFSAPVAILAASLLFASLHFGNYVGGVGAIVAWSLMIGGVGVVFGVLYEKTRSLTVPIVAHGIYNFVLFVASYLMF